MFGESVPSGAPQPALTAQTLLLLCVNIVVLAPQPVLTADVAPGSDGDLGVAGCAGGALEVLSLRTGAPVAKLEGHVLDVLSARFFPSGKVVLSASSDMSLRIWSAEDGRCAAVLRGHTAGVCGTGIIDRGRNVVCTCA